MQNLQAHIEELPTSLFIKIKTCRFRDIMCAGNSYTVEPLNKGHFGNNINSAVMSFVERLFSSRRFKLYYNYRKTIIWDLEKCPL